MSAICHTLRVFGYLTLLPYLAYAKGESFKSCMRDPGAAPLGLSLAFVTFLCIIGYGNILRGRPRGSTLLFWISNTGFYALVASLVFLRSGGRILAEAANDLIRFTEAVFPHFRADSALFAVGGLTGVILAIWMPVAAVLSLIATVMTLLERSGRSASLMKTKNTEQAAP